MDEHDDRRARSGRTGVERAADVGIVAVRVGISAIPGVGGPALEALNPLLRTSLERRRERLLDDVVKRLAVVERRIDGMDLSRIGDYPPFASALAKAVQLAFSTHDDTKLTVLRNAVVNVVVDRSLDGHIQSLFWKWIGELEALHVVALDFFSRPQPYRTLNDPTIPPHSPGSMADLALLSIPDFGNRVDLSQVVIRDLIDRRLLRDDGAQLFVDLDEQRRMRPMISELGELFLAFITDPLDRMDAATIGN